MDDGKVRDERGEGLLVSRARPHRDVGQSLRNVYAPQRVLHGDELGLEEGVEGGAVEHLDDGRNGRALPLGVSDGHERKVESGLSVREHLPVQARADEVNSAITVEIGLDGVGRRDTKQREARRQRSHATP